jgi:single-stranded-DNA-specific exonuclease
MSFASAARTLAEHLLEQHFVEVTAHHDADGIAAGAILCHALHRAGIGFRLRVRSRIIPGEISPDGAALLCDLGSSIAELPDNVMVVDHHIPHFDGRWHINPHLYGIDGETELSSSGAAYYVARELGDNRDLAGLALLGMIGDGQECTGKNHEICSEGMANGFISPHRGIRLIGRDTREQLFLALSPYLDGISGNEDEAGSLAELHTAGDKPDMDTLLSGILLRIAPQETATAMESLYGDTYELEREILHNAHTFAALVDACGLTGNGGLAAALCLRSADGIGEAWEHARAYRLRVIEAIRTARQPDPSLPFYEIGDAAALRGVADAFARDFSHETAVCVAACAEDNCTLSLRCPSGEKTDLEELVRSLADTCGGRGGGHRTRAGAVIGPDCLDCFRRGFAEAVA